MTIGHKLSIGFAMIASLIVALAGIVHVATERIPRDLEAISLGNVHETVPATSAGPEAQTAVSLKSVKATVNMLRMVAPATAVLGVLLAIQLSYLVSRSITRPLAGLTDAAARVAQGQMDARADCRSADEIGVLTRTFNEMMDRLSAEAENRT